MYFEDVPIRKQEEDLLHRRGFAKRLGRTLVDADVKEGYCVGLFGSWGSGKSSIVNMVLEEVNAITETDEEKPIVMYFNPWNFSSAEQLLQQYFVMLADKFSTRADKRLSKIGEEIKNYAGMFDVLGDLGKVLGTGGQVLGGLLKAKTLTGDKDISKQRDLIVKELAKQKCKIIIVIDDIDRLSNNEIKMIFQLVNSVAKFPNTIYLLAFDKEIVARALSEVQNYDGEKYLEKIVQVPIEVPEISNDCLWEVLFDKLNGIMEKHSKMIFEAEYWSNVFYGCVSKYIRNLRDVIRISNSLNIKCDMIGSEVNFADLIAITVVENKLPDLYRWIKNNKARLVGGSSELSLQQIGKSTSEIEKIYTNPIEKLNADMAEEYLKILKLLFPYFSTKTSGGTYYQNENLRRKLRIGHEDIFDRCFALDVDDKVISRTEIDYAIKEMSVEELIYYINEVNEKKSIINFLKELGAAIEELDKERIYVITKVLLNTANGFKGESTNGWFEISAFDMALYRIRDMLKELKDEECYELLKDVIQNINQDSIQVFSHLFNIIELAHGRLSANGQENGGEKLINIEQLEICEGLLLEQIKKLSETNCIMDLKRGRMILHLFEGFDNEGYMQYMSDLLKQDLYKLKFLCFSINKWTSGSVISWEKSDGYKQFLDDDEIIQAYTKCVEDKSINKLNNDELHRVIAYQLWKNDEVGWRGEVQDKEVIGAIEALRTKHNL